MKIAITRWGSRIAPLYDTARELLVVHVEDGMIREHKKINVGHMKPFSRADFLQGLGVEVLLCDGISQHLLLQLNAAAIQVISGMSGELDEVVRRYIRTSAK